MGVATPALSCHREPAQGTQCPPKGAILALLVKNQGKARNAPSRGHFIPKLLVGGCFITAGRHDAVSSHRQSSKYGSVNETHGWSCVIFIRHIRLLLRIYSMVGLLTELPSLASHELMTTHSSRKGVPLKVITQTSYYWSKKITNCTELWVP